MTRSRSRKAVIRGDILKHQHNELKIPHTRETIHTAPGKLPADFTFAWGATGDSSDKSQPKQPSASKTVTPDTKQTSESSAAEEEAHAPKAAPEKAVDTGKGDDRKRKREKKGEEDEGIPEEPEGSEQPHQTRSSRQKARR